MTAADPAARMVRVWDPVVRGFHWVTALSFFGAYFLLEPRNLHEYLGLSVGAAVALRIVWGLIGSEHARFSDFVPSPARLLAYARDACRGRERRYLGHNPAGGAMVVALLALLALTSGTGWLLTTDAYWGVTWMKRVHDAAASTTLALVGLHIAGVVWESLRHRENLVKAMVTGFKRR